MTYRLITTGAESSGKTTLAKQLAHALSAPLVQEVSRSYLEGKYAEDPQFQYQEEDLLRIAQQQLAHEEALSHTAPYLICDTDLLVILVWSEVKYGRIMPALTDLFTDSLAQHKQHYFLCDWQIPWQADPLRENPHNRHELFQHYLDKLHYYELPFTRVQGSPQQRLTQALSILPTLSQ